MNALLRALQSFGQGASNAVASNVSFPVDAIAWALRKGGLPIPQNPVGGSDWMAQKGLTATPQNRIAGLLGETVGMVGPAVVQAAAPKIAGGLLALDDKAMDMARQGIERRMVNSGMIQPATVWHGSPHKFNKFDSSKMGTGEGAQAYGDGIYTAEAQGVGEGYRKTLSGGDLTPQELQEQIRRAKYLANTTTNEMARQGYLNAIKQLEENGGKQGYLYKVDLSDNAIARMLDWDKPISEQPQAVRDALAKLPKGWATGSGGQRQFIDPAMSRKTGGGLLEELKMLRRGQPEELLRQQGIPGIRYLDEGSRDAGAGTSNYVVFPGNEDLLQILERNGVPIK